MRRIIVMLAILGLFVMGARRAHAADPIAESMFQQALQMMRDGKFEEARKSLEASQKLEPKSGTLLVLGSCNEQLGRTATAWAQYKEAAGLARVEGRTEHATKATDLARALEGRLSKLRIDGQRMQGGVSLVVKLDGGVVLDGALGVSFAIDPGDHVITASAPGRADWSTTIRIAPGESQIVAVPELDLAPVATPQPPVAQRPFVPPPVPINTTEASEPVWPWVIGGIGVALGATAIGFGIDQRIVSDELEDKCGERRASCPNDYDFMAARDREVRDFGLFLGLGIGGLGGVAAGIIGLVAVPGEPAASAARLDVGPGYAAVVGSF
ncbi:MAG: hypothetical protein HOV80_12300 [Polyangiaceae bacterium]|nr:hypothetical protein [Polyangiaceae bacterium]